MGETPFDILIDLMLVIIFGSWDVCNGKRDLCVSSFLIFFRGSMNSS